MVDYRALVEAPKRTRSRRSTPRLGLPLSPAYEKALDEEEARSRSHRGEHVYSLGEFGLEPGEIRARLGDLFERYGWEPEPPRGAVEAPQSATDVEPAEPEGEDAGRRG